MKKNGQNEYVSSRNSSFKYSTVTRNSSGEIYVKFHFSECMKWVDWERERVEVEGRLREVENEEDINIMIRGKK